MIGGKVTAGPRRKGTRVTEYGAALYRLADNGAFYLKLTPTGWRSGPAAIAEYVLDNPPPQLDQYAPAGHPDTGAALLRAIANAVSGRLTFEMQAGVEMPEGAVA